MSKDSSNPYAPTAFPIETPAMDAAFGIVILFAVFAYVALMFLFVSIPSQK